MSSSRVSRLGIRKISLLDGCTIAFQEWGNISSPRKILASHGWLDNSNTFSAMGPYLGDKGYHFIAYDIAGHGLSSHFTRGTMYLFQKSVSHLRDIVLAITEDNAESAKKGELEINILGHSMGGSISLLYASCFPESVNGKLILIDSFGQFTKTPEVTTSVLRNGIENELKHLQSTMYATTTKFPKIYASFDAAVDARVNSATRLPGNLTISREAAVLLLQRGTEPVDVSPASNSNQPSTTSESIFPPVSVDASVVIASDPAMNSNTGSTSPTPTPIPTLTPVRFVHDAALLLPNYYYSTEEQIINVLDNIKTNTLLITAETGFPFTKFNNRIDVLKQKQLITHVVLPGSHHLHLDPDSSTAVNECVAQFLQAS